MVITDAEGNLGHSQMKFGDDYIMVGPEWAVNRRPKLTPYRRAILTP